MTRRAIVVGGGIAGLSSAIALQQAGWLVQVYEQAPQLEPMGAALSMWPNAMTALSLLGCDALIREQSLPITKTQLGNAEGRSLFVMNVAELFDEEQAYLPTRTLLQTALLGGLGSTAVNLSYRLKSFSQNETGVAVSFENGETAEADLLIAADGIRSLVAEKTLNNPVHHCGYGGVLGMSAPVSGAGSALCSGEYWGHHERLGLFDLNSGGKYWFYMKNEASSVETKEIDLHFLRRHMTGWHPAIVEAIDATAADKLIPFSIHAKSPPKRLGMGRVICIGDAAHAMEPNMGQGGCQALEDAIALGAAARKDDVDLILPHFERLRLKRVRKFVSLSKQGTIVPHGLPKPLAKVAQFTMSKFMPIVAKRQLKSLFHLPDYSRTV